VKSFRDLPEILCEQIAHFFQHYKDLEKGKWVTVVRWADPAEAADLIRAAIARERGAERKPTKPARASRRQGRRKR
jgi:inorganic pyrophosphatase